MKIAFTVQEVCQTSYTRYKYYRWPDGLAMPEDWDKWSVDDKYTWANNNCHFHSDYAEETDSVVISKPQPYSSRKGTVTKITSNSPSV